MSQAQAVAGLASMQPVHEGVIDVLAAALRRPNLFCRVRADAALALGATAGEGTYFRGANALLDYWRWVVWLIADRCLTLLCYSSGKLPHRALALWGTSHMHPNSSRTHSTQQTAHTTHINRTGTRATTPRPQRCAPTASRTRQSTLCCAPSRRRSRSCATARGGCQLLQLRPLCWISQLLLRLPVLLK